MPFLLASSIIVELFLASIGFCWHTASLRWHRLWVLPVALFLLTAVFALFLSGGVAADPSAQMGDAPFVVCFYVLAFALSTASLAYVFGISPVCALVVGTLGYCNQHFWSDVSVLLLDSSIDASPTSPIYYGPHIAILLAGFIVVFLLIGRRFKIDEAVVSKRIFWVMGSAAAIVFVIMFTLMVADAQTGSARAACYVYDALCTALIMTVLVWASRFDSLRADLAAQEAIWDQRRAQYELTRESVDLINIKCHDIRKRVAQLEAGEGRPLSPETVRKVQESIRVYDANAKTGNGALDVVLTQKGLLCTQRGIELDCMADGAALGFVPNDDVYSLFDNILDNAIEAVLALDDAEKRSINLTVRREGGFAVIREDNYYAGALSFEDGLPRTTKGDEKNHGFGMRSIRRFVDERGGHMGIRAEDGVFSLSILLPIPSLGDSPACPRS